MRILQHISDLTVQPELGTFPIIHASIKISPDVGSKNLPARFTIVDLPAPVSPTIATVVPTGIFRFRCSSTYSLPSGYRKLTSRNSISPRIGSQFSRFGSPNRPYLSSTSGVSVIFVPAPADPPLVLYWPARNHIRQESCQLLDRFKDSHCVKTEIPTTYPVQ